MPSPLFLQARASIDATAADRPARVAILAYAGGIMNVPGWGPVGIELAGLERPDSVNLLADHDGRLSGVVGSGRPRVERGELTVEGTLSRASEAARQIIALAADGIGWGASVGIEPLGGFDFIPERTKVTLNGRQVISPRNGFRLLRSARLREVSITALAADPHTSVAITARTQGNHPMDFNAWLQARGFDPEQLTDFHRDTLQAQYDAEQAAGNQGTGNEGDNAMQATVDQLRADLQAVRVEMLRASRPSGPVGTGGHSPGSRGDVAEAALLCHLGAEHVAEEHFGDAVIQGARDLRLTSLVECLQAAWVQEVYCAACRGFR